MSRRCQITGRGPQVGHKVSHAHNLTLRRWNVNLQKVRVLINGQVKRIRVSTQAIKSGLITRPPITIKQRKPREIRPQSVTPATAVSADLESGVEYFSESSVVSRLFKPKAKPEEVVIETSEMLSEEFNEETQSENNA